MTESVDALNAGSSTDTGEARDHLRIPEAHQYQPPTVLNETWTGQCTCGETLTVHNPHGPIDPNEIRRVSAQHLQQHTASGQRPGRME